MAIAPTECPSWSNSPTTPPPKAPPMHAVMNGRPRGERHTVDQRLTDTQESGRQRTADGPHERGIRPKPHPQRDARTDLPGTTHRQHGQQHGPPGLVDRGDVARAKSLVHTGHDERQEEASEHEAGEGSTVREQPGRRGPDRDGDDTGDGHQDPQRDRPGDEHGDGRHHDERDDVRRDSPHEPLDVSGEDATG